MTPKQNRAYNRARSAIDALMVEGRDSDEVLNATIGLLTGRASALLATALVVGDYSQDEALAAINKTARHLQSTAATSYAELLAEMIRKDDRGRMQ